MAKTIPHRELHPFDDAKECQNARKSFDSRAFGLYTRWVRAGWHWQLVASD